MTYVIQFFGMMLTALFIENIIFTRAFGTSWLLHVLRNPKELFRCTLLLTVITTLSGALGYPFRNFAEESKYSDFFLPMLYIGCIVFVYLVVFLFIRIALPKVFCNTTVTLSTAAFNCAVLGSLMVPALNNLDFIGTLGYGLGMSLGFAFAVIILGLGMERIKLCHVPKAFQGLPVTLIYLGLLSLAFYGLVGHQLPT